MARTNDTVGETLGEASLDSCYRALARERRRIVVAALEDRPEVSLDELAAEIVARDDGARSSARVETTLLHNHLPVLADVGAIDFDGERVRRDGATFDRLSELNRTAT